MGYCIVGFEIMKGKSDVGYVEIHILDTFEYVPIQVGPYAPSCSLWKATVKITKFML